MSAHSRWSPSSRHRWSACPGSVRLIERINPPETVSADASEGTVAHATAADCLLNGRDCTDPDIQAYLDYARGLPGALMVEKELRHPDYPDLHGTSDLVAFDFGGRLTICDFKFGAGVGVGAEDNPQLQMYAVMAAAELGDVDEVCLAIFQPRYDGAPLKEAIYPASKLKGWEQEILDEVVATDAEDAPLVPGVDQCRFCPVKAHCPALASSTQLAAGLQATMPAPENLRPEQLAWLLESEGVISAYLKSVKAYALTQALAGTPPPGWKATEQLGNRRWKDEAETMKALKALKKKPDEYAPRALLSPAQMEARGLLERKYLEIMVERPVTGAKLVRDTAPGQALVSTDVFEKET